mmetsp:Transcript_144654/g.262729  ORF Transcript_144654/g.262729 Transcript_144654/m.262729 type:complete len:294 (-) Transcript_144654:205-1086(-)
MMHFRCVALFLMATAVVGSEGSNDEVHDDGHDEVAALQVTMRPSEKQRENGSSTAEMDLAAHEMNLLADKIATQSKMDLAANGSESGYYLLRGPGKEVCQDGTSSELTTEKADTAEECQSVCDKDPKCKFAMLWYKDGGSWCRTTKTCKKLGAQSQYVVLVYLKLETITNKTIKAATKSLTELKYEACVGSDYCLVSGPAPFYCFDGWGADISIDKFTTKDDCQKRCDRNPQCNFMQLWTNDGQSYCRTTKSCAKVDRLDAYTILVFAKPHEENTGKLVQRIETAGLPMTGLS